MSLLTPPSTSHRNKQRSSLAAGSRISWSQHNHCKVFTASPPRNIPSIPSSRARAPPARSILKRVARSLLPALEAVAPTAVREPTPEPSLPLDDPHYLERPVSIIVAEDVPFRDLVDAYTQFTARLRAAVTDHTDTERQHPLLAPIRANRQALVSALTEHARKATVDPSVECASSTAPVSSCDEEAQASLPSPKASPTKRRQGLTAEQVIFARDLCSISQAAIKTIAIITAYPAIYSIFSTAELRDLLTAVLAVPMTPELPTPNARKTYACAIWAIQQQRLPEQVLISARDRIAYVLRRGIEGELGKEGKKGSIFDGLKAIHDLCRYMPSVFVPAFADIIPAVLSNLLAPTLVLRTQACHALGGFAIASTRIPLSIAHTRASAHVANFLTTKSRSGSVSGSPSSPSKDPQIVRTLRTTLNTQDPAHPAQGPAWALCTLAASVVILGSKLYTEPRVLRTMNALLTLTMKHKKSSVRGLGCLVWRCLTWVYFQPALPEEEEIIDDEEEQEEGESEVSEDEERASADAKADRVAAARERFWTVVLSIVEMGTGVTTIASLLGADDEQMDSNEALHRSLDLLRLMVKKGGLYAQQALEVVNQLLGSWAAPREDDASLQQPNEWDWNRLLAPSLFSPASSLLVAEYRLLAQAVRPLFEQTAGMEDVRWLTREELATDWVFDGLVAVWKAALLAYEWPGNMGGISEAPFDIFAAMIMPGAEAFNEWSNSHGMANLADRAVDVLVELVQDPTFCSGTNTPDPEKTLLDIESAGESTAEALLTVKHTVLGRLWGKMRGIFSREYLERGIAPKLFSALISNAGGLENMSSALASWAVLSADVLVYCDSEELKLVCGLDESRWSQDWSAQTQMLVWREVSKQWAILGDNADGVNILLTAPFTTPDSWELGPAEFKAWDHLLELAMKSATDNGHDRASVLDDIASAILRSCTSSRAPALADNLISRLDMDDAREVPADLFALVNETLLTAYTEVPDVAVFWLLRGLTRAIESCASELVVEMLESVQDGVSIWVADEDTRCNLEAHYATDILALYEAIMLRMQDIPLGSEVLGTMADVISSGLRGRTDKPAAMKQAFTSFYQSALDRISEVCWPVQITTYLGSDLRSIIASTEPSESDEVPSIIVPKTPPLVVREIIDIDAIVDEEPLSFPDSDDEATISLLEPVSDLPETPGAEQLRSLDNASEPPLSSAPSTPRTELSSLVSPSRPPRRVHVEDKEITAPILVFRPPAPRTPKRGSISPSRPPLSQKGRSARASGDKENASPTRPIISALQRFPAQTSPLSPSKLGKRRATDDMDVDNEVPASKRLRTSSTTSKDILLPLLNSSSLAISAPPITVNMFYGSSSSGNNGASTSASTSTSMCSKSQKKESKEPEKRGRKPRQSAASSKPETPPVEDDAGSEDSDTPTPTVPPKKRKRVIMECIELPTLSMVQSMRKESEEQELLQRRSTVPKAESPARRVTRSMRRTMSEVVPETREQPSAEVTTPRKRSRGDTEIIPALSLGLTPIRALIDTQVIGSDDSIMLAGNDDGEDETEMPSSDDDPRVGQVTPRNLLSPALRRTFDLDDDDDLGSDDPVLASPSRNRVAHRTKGLTSH